MFSNINGFDIGGWYTHMAWIKYKWNHFYFVTLQTSNDNIHTQAKSTAHYIVSNAYSFGKCGFPLGLKSTIIFENWLTHGELFTVFFILFKGCAIDFYGQINVKLTPVIVLSV